MAWQGLVRGVRDVLSFCGLGFLVQYGLQMVSTDSGNYLVRKHVFGYFILASALAVAYRFRAESRRVIAKENRALTT